MMYLQCAGAFWASLKLFRAQLYFFWVRSLPMTHLQHHLDAPTRSHAHLRWQRVRDPGHLRLPKKAVRLWILSVMVIRMGNHDHSLLTMIFLINEYLMDIYCHIWILSLLFSLFLILSVIFRYYVKQNTQININQPYIGSSSKRSGLLEDSPPYIVHGAPNHADS